MKFRGHSQQTRDGLRLMLTVLLWLTWCGPLLAASDTKPDNVEEYRRFEAIAGEPQDSVRFFRVYYWQPIDEHALVLWLGREEPYLLDLRDGCRGLMKQMSLRIADYQRPGRNTLRAIWSQIIADDGRSCRIDSIRALDFSRVNEIHPRYVPKGPASAVRKNEAEPKPTAGDPANPPQDGRRWMNLVSIQMPDADYPRRAIRRGREGVTHVAAEVNTYGEVVSTEVLISSGNEDLDAAALRAVMKWRFETYRSEVPNEHVWVQVPIVFALP
jgi:TonB family protein